MTTRIPAILLTCLLAFPVAAAGFPVGPSAPTGLAATPGPGPGAISLAWQPAESLAGVEAYHVYRVQDDGALLLVGATDGATTAFTETDLGNGVTATYVVAAVDVLGEGPASEPATATTFTTPSAPQDVHASPGPVGSVGEIAVAWSAPVSDGGLPVAAYLVFRDGEPVATVGADATTWTDAGRDPTRGHVYAVSAVNAAGEGPQAAAACSMASPWGLVPGAPACLGSA